jgi:hypothetical protein
MGDDLWADDGNIIQTTEKIHGGKKVHQAYTKKRECRHKYFIPNRFSSPSSSSSILSCGKFYYGNLAALSLPDEPLKETWLLILAAWRHIFSLYHAYHKKCGKQKCLTTTKKIADRIVTE